jgi:membrane protease YdiL (CAAX protease family)
LSRNVNLKDSPVIRNSQARSGQYGQNLRQDPTAEFALGLNCAKTYCPAMRPLRALVIYLVVVFIGGALLAPLLYRLAQTAGHAFPQIASAPFHRFVNRSLLIFALAGLWTLLCALGATSWRETGLVQIHGQWNKFYGGLLLGFVSLAVVAGTAIGGGDRVFIPGLTAHKIVGIIFDAIATAAVVGTIEEILFRGGIFGGLRRILHWQLALIVSSVIFALVHFLQRAEFTGPVAWNSGLILLPRMLGGFADFHVLVPGFINLTLAGFLLGLAYQRTGNLYFSIGLHVGWIFWLKTYDAFTTGAPRAATWFYGTGKLIDGWLALMVLVVSLVVVGFLPLKPPREPFAISR